MGLLCCLARTSERDLVPWPPSIEAACWSGLVATLLLVVAMAAPYWLVSWQDTQSPFLRMGPWEACFYRYRTYSQKMRLSRTTKLPKRVTVTERNLFGRFRFPRFQFDHLFTGCDPVWGHEYRLIRWPMKTFLQQEVQSVKFSPENGSCLLGCSQCRLCSSSPSSSPSLLGSSPSSPFCVSRSPSS